MVEAGEPLIQQAIEAMREYHQAQDRGAPAEEVERLRLLAESLFQAVSDYQLRAVAKASRQGAASASLGCPSAVAPVRIPPLSPEARQPTAPLWCSPTCSHGLMIERESWRRLMIKPE